MKLQPKKFRYTSAYIARNKGIEADQYYYQFIAQEYQKVFPDYVTETNESYGRHKNILQLDANPALFVAIQAVKELDAENKLLKSKLADLEARLSALE